MDNIISLNWVKGVPSSGRHLCLLVEMIFMQTVQVKTAKVCVCVEWGVCVVGVGELLQCISIKSLAKGIRGKESKIQSASQRL